MTGFNDLTDETYENIIYHTIHSTDIADIKLRVTPGFIILPTASDARRAHRDLLKVAAVSRWFMYWVDKELAKLHMPGNFQPSLLSHSGLVLRGNPHRIAESKTVAESNRIAEGDHSINKANFLAVVFMVLSLAITIQECII